MFKKDDNDEKKIIMVEGDFGIVLPIEIETEDDEVITNLDSFSVKIFKGKNTDPLITRTYSDITDKTINFGLTKEQSSLLQPGSYLYDIDWYQGNLFMNNIVSKAKFIVEEKAGALNES